LPRASLARARCGYGVRDGFYRWFLFQVEPIRDEAGRIVSGTGRRPDIEDRKRAELASRAEKRTLEMIGDGASLEDILDELCRSIEVQAPTTVSTVLLMAPDGKHLWHAAGSHVPRDWLPASAHCRLARAQVVRRCRVLKQRVIIADVATDPVCSDEHRQLPSRMESWRRGPAVLTKDREVLGTFALYARSSDAHRCRAELIEGAGHIALIAIGRQHPGN